jgi:hypothetical protein
VICAFQNRHLHVFAHKKGRRKKIFPWRQFAARDFQKILTITAARLPSAEENALGQAAAATAPLIFHDGFRLLVRGWLLGFGFQGQRKSHPVAYFRPLPVVRTLHKRNWVYLIIFSNAFYKF